MKYYLKTAIILVVLFVSMLLMEEITFAATYNIKDTDIEWTDGVTGGTIYFDLSTGTITGCSETTTDVVIPTQISGKAVTALDAYAFSDCKLLRNITIPNSVENIPSEAFNGCIRLENINIEEGNLQYKSVDGVLYDSDIKQLLRCPGGKASISIPNSVEGINHYAFDKCVVLSEITIPSSVMAIQPSVFNGCINLKNINVDENNPQYKSIDGVLYDEKVKYLFSCPGGKDSVSIPDTVEAIGLDAFYECKFLEEIILPNSVTSIRTRAFYGCTSLNRIELTNNVKSISGLAFSKCESLSEITIPSGTTGIGAYTFSGCKSLKKVVIPSSVTYIRIGAFEGCKSLSTITLPNGVNHIGEGAFYGCISLRNLVLPNSLQMIDVRAFGECISLKEITIPRSVAQIEGRIFVNCTSLKKVTIQNGITKISYGSFEGCESLSEVIIPNSVQTIESQAFEGCKSLTEIIIPSSVTTIEMWAFKECTSLNNITIPNSIKNIGEDTFSGCTSLKQITLPDSIPEIESGLFRGCTSLREITIPSMVNKIDGSAFENCTALRKISLPNSMTYIGSDAFRNCTSLSRVIIPNGVSRIYWGAFSGCKALKEIFIPNSVTEIYNDAFENCPSLKYIVGEFGSYAENYAKNNNFKFRSITEDAATEIPTSKYGICIVDSAGNPLSGATVTFAGTSKETDSRGLALFDALTIGTPSIRVSKNGYETWTNQNMNYEKSSKGYDIITLYKTNETGLKVTEAKYNDSLDLCNKTKKLTIPYKSVDTKFSLTVKTKQSNSAIRFELWQNTKKIAETDSKGKFQNLKASSFSAGKGVCIRAYDAKGKYYSTPINLIFIRRDIPKITQFQLGGDSLEIVASSKIPIIGGRKIKIKGLEKLPVVLKIKDDTVYVTLNMYDSSENGSDFTSQQWNKFNKIRNIPKGGYTKENEDTIKRLFKEIASQKPTGNVTVKIAGCGSVKLDQIGSISQFGVNLYVLVEAKGSVSFQTVVVVVPLTANFTLTGSIKGEASAIIDLKTNKIGGELTATGGIKLSAFGGIGVGKVISGGVYGDGKVELVYVILSNQEAPGVKSLILSWNLGLKAYFLGMEKEYPIIGDEYYLYTRTGTPQAMMLSADGGNQVFGLLYDISSYKPQDVSYLVNESGWLGQGVAAYSLSHSANGAVKIQPLLTNTYEDSQPTIAASSDNMAIAYLRADTSRNVYNMTQVMYSVFDEATGTWGEPKALDSADVTGDYAPQLFSDGKDIFLIYQDSSRVFDEESSDISEYAKAQTIKAAVFDAATQTFTNIAALSPSDEDGVKYHSQPRLGLVDGVLTAAWVANGNAEDVFGQNAGNEIWAAQYIGGQWQPANKLLGEENCIADLTVGNSGIAYIRDEDNNLATDADRSLRLLSMDGNTVEIASGKLSGLKTSELNGEKVLTWLNEDGLYKYANDAELVCADFGAAEYQIAGDNIYFTASEDETSSNLYKAIYDAQTKTYQSAAALTDSSEYVENVSVADFKGRTYAALVQSLVTLSEDAVDRKCDLAWCRLNEVTDLTLVSADYEQTDVAVGSTLPVQIQLQNNGTTDIETVNITITDTSGNTAYSAAETIGLAPGQETEVTANLTMPDSITNATYNLSVSASEEDKNPADNETSLTVGYADLAVSHELVQIGNQQSLCVTVSNDGFTSSAGTLTVSYGEETTYETQVEALGHGENTTFVISLSDMELSNGESGTIDISVTAEAEEKELSNNTEKVYFDLDYEITYFAGDGENGERPFLQENKRYDEAFEITDLSPVKSGYRLAGWSRESGSQEVEYQAQDYLDDNRNVTLYAVWEKNTSPAGRVYGDADGNDKVDFADALYLKRHIADWDAYKTIDTATSDLNKDGVIDLRDLMLLEQHIAGWTGSAILPIAN